MWSAGEEMRESGEWGRVQARAERDETRRVRVRGASLLRGSSRSRDLYLGRAGRTDHRARPANSCSQVSQLPHTYSEGGRQCVIHLASKRLDG